MTNIHYPKCPYCKTEYSIKSLGTDYTLMDLATKGYVKEKNVTCCVCGKKYIITLTLMYYSRKINKGGG